ncbi:DUF4932 domain-containing protein [Flavobacterium ardleyense]|uniref:DUF4932 domain-containing protein n=1 Tax=Flavobacterium ardleyense TaxID=2038737 RepID=A0ABW5ZBC8_9FLAO
MKKEILLLSLFYVLLLSSCKDQNESENPIIKTPETKKVVFQVDERIEFLRIVFNIAVEDFIDHDMLPCATEYSKRVSQHFDPFKNHTLIKYVNELPNIAIDFPTIGLMFTDCKSFQFEKTYTNELSNFGISKNELDSLQPLLLDFYKTSDFENFFATNDIYYKKALEKIEKQVNEEKLFDYITDFYHSNEKDLQMIVFVELTNNANNKAISFFDNYNTKKRATILGNMCDIPEEPTSDNEILELDNTKRSILYHETSHLFTDKLLNKYIGAFSQYESLCEDCSEIQIKDKVDHLIVFPLQTLLSYRKYGKDDGHNFYLNECKDVRRDIYLKLSEYQPENKTPFEQTYAQCIELIKKAALKKQSLLKK